LVLGSAQEPEHAQDFSPRVLDKSIESVKKQIEEHFDKLGRDVREKNEVLARYHIKEIDKSLIDDLENRIKLLGGKDLRIVERYRKRLREIAKEIEGLSD